MSKRFATIDDAVAKRTRSSSKLSRGYFHSQPDGIDSLSSNFTRVSKSKLLTGIKPMVNLKSDCGNIRRTTRKETHLFDGPDINVG
ncbi:uncharacterized protein KGF55_002660 [Candida pseudojiufengensis]|uniref:uncharacterized protein n=1 Tax=Candida pseudojiufengensis TaxID=497109 RepID=UPI002225B067|nr:uncharacterized protein KGF55_002660 [Candida pseudojiufengensis]KAI5963780.1 hypothetical protein KGF55_002660 [Candida pseudojiufengensis]